MKIERAKELLSGNFHDPEAELEQEITEALEMLETHPELQDWMEKQEQMDPLMKEALEEASIPDGLEEDLLAIVGSANKKTSIRSWLIRGSAVAAVLVLGGLLLTMTPGGEKMIQGMQARVQGNSPDEIDHFRDSMAYFINNVYFQLDHRSKDVDSIESWLIDHDSPVFDAIPEELLALNPIGCKELQWQGRGVSLVCFRTEDGNIVHMFLMDKASSTEAGYSDISTVALSQGLETGGWVAGDKVYLLVGSGPGVDVEFALG